jgi:hypothetical protein
MPVKAVVEEKQPPLCDICSNPFEADEEGNYNLQALVLKDRHGESIWGLVCEDCREKLEKLEKIKIYNEFEKPKAAQTLVDAMQHELLEVF